MVRARRLLPALALAVLAAGCGSSLQPPPVTTSATATAATTRRPAPAPAICGALAVRHTGRVGDPAATELSGLVASPDQPGILWTHNDSGDRPRVFAVRANGTVVADLDVPGAEAVDWEDIAIGPSPGGGRALYLGDSGDNAAQRATIDVYRVPEPRVPSAAGTTAPAVRLRLSYPDGPHDAETLLVDPRSGELAIVTKQLSGESGVYVARHPDAAAGGATLTLRHVATLHLDLGGLATGGDVSADGRVVAVRTYTGLVAWAKRPGASLAATLRRAPCRGEVSLGGEGQGEALALSRDGRGFWTVPEGGNPPIRRYRAARR